MMHRKELFFKTNEYLNKKVGGGEGLLHISICARKNTIFDPIIGLMVESRKSKFQKKMTNGLTKSFHESNQVVSSFEIFFEF